MQKIWLREHGTVAMVGHLSRRERRTSGQVSSNILASTLLVPKAVVVIKTQCSLCGLNSVCLMMRIGCELASLSLDGLPRSTATCDVLAQICLSLCVVRRIATGLECHETILRLARKISRLTQSIKTHFQVAHQRQGCGLCRTIL